MTVSDPSSLVSLENDGQRQISNFVANNTDSLNLDNFDLQELLNDGNKSVVNVPLPIAEHEVEDEEKEQSQRYMSIL